VFHPVPHANSILDRGNHWDDPTIYGVLRLYVGGAQNGAQDMWNERWNIAGMLKYLHHWMANLKIGGRLCSNAFCLTSRVWISNRF
jgi:hypothetical protein